MVQVPEEWKEIVEGLPEDDARVTLLRALVEMQKWAAIEGRGKERIWLIDYKTGLPYCKIIWSGPGRYAGTIGPKGVYMIFPISGPEEARDFSASYFGEVEDLPPLFAHAEERSMERHVALKIWGCELGSVHGFMAAEVPENHGEAGESLPS